MNEPKITVDYVAPPIPVNCYDWCAQYVGCDGYYAGWGATKDAAIVDLRRLYWENSQ